MSDIMLPTGQHGRPSNFLNVASRDVGLRCMETMTLHMPGPGTFVRRHLAEEGFLQEYFSASVQTTPSVEVGSIGSGARDNMILENPGFLSVDISFWGAGPAEAPGFIRRD